MPFPKASGMPIPTLPKILTKIQVGTRSATPPASRLLSREGRVNGDRSDETSRELKTSSPQLRHLTGSFSRLIIAFRKPLIVSNFPAADRLKSRTTTVSERGALLDGNFLRVSRIFKNELTGYVKS
jgi:hypothetical protein